MADKRVEPAEVTVCLTDEEQGSMRTLRLEVAEMEKLIQTLYDVVMRNPVIRKRSNNRIGALGPPAVPIIEESPAIPVLARKV